MLIDFRIQGIEAELRVSRFDGFEGISELFDVEIILLGDARDPVEIDDVLGRDACLTVNGLHGPRHVHGVLGRFEHLEQADAGRGPILYGATLLPRVHRLLHRYDCRIFLPEEGQTLTVVQILNQVLTGAGLSAGNDYRMALAGQYTPRDQCAQYRESDWAFCCRLMEEEGIFYFFEHQQDGHLLVIADASAVHEDIDGGSVRFREMRGALRGDEDVTRFRYAGQVRPDAITLRDYNFETPGVPLKSSVGAAPGGPLSVYDYPGGYAKSDNGDRRAQIRLEEQNVLRKQGRGESRCPRLVPGYVFELHEHPRDTANQRYLVTRVEHHGCEPVMVAEGEGEAGPSYENHFQCIPASVPFRPPRITPRPVIQGMQTAVVVCPSGEEIETDSHGRVKVRFHWEAERSSCWVRVGQAWSGAGFGAMFIPRKGQEVLVDFLEGDPDRPVVVGSLYNAALRVPYRLPDEKTKSVLAKSNTDPGGGGSNELRLEDKKGSEEVYLHAQKDLVVKVEHDADVEVKNDRRAAVEANEKLSVGGDRTTEVKGNHTEKVDGEKKVQVGKSFTEEIAEDLSVAVGGDRAEHVAGKSVLKVDGPHTMMVGANRTEQVAGQSLLKVDGFYTVMVGANRTDHVAGQSVLGVDGLYTVTVGGNRDEIVMGNSSTIVQGGYTLLVNGQPFQIACGSSGMAMGPAGLVIDGAPTLQLGRDSVKLTMGPSGMTIEAGPALQLACGTSGMTIGPAGMTIEGGPTLQLACGGVSLTIGPGGVMIDGGQLMVNNRMVVTR